MTRNPDLPFGGYGSPCGNLPLQRRRAEQHERNPFSLPPVYVDFPDLADCRECDMCGGCETHEGCLTDMGHIEWRMMFASPGETVCGHEWTRNGRPHVCALPVDHEQDWHLDRRGNGQKVAKPRARGGRKA